MESCGIKVRDWDFLISIKSKEMLRALLSGGGEILHAKMGPGVLGITGIVCSVALVAVGIATYSLRSVPETLVFLVVAILVFTGLFVAGSWIFASIQPNLALLGGAELVKHEELQMAAKDKTIVIDQQPTTAGAPLAPPEGHDDV